MSTRSASVIGAGVVSPAGSTVDDLWRVVHAADGTLAEVVTFPGMPDNPALVCSAAGFDPAERLERHELRRLDRSHQMAIWAADDAIAEAGDGPTADRCAVVVGIGIGAAAFHEQQFAAFSERGFRAVSPLAVPVVMPNSVAAHLSLRFGFRGPSVTVSSACASGTMAVGEALWLLRTERADRVLVGGVDALITPSVVAPFLRMEAMSTRVGDPEGSSRPFGPDRDGFVLGEGAAFLVLERSNGAAEGRGTILGYASNSDAHHVVAPAEHGVGALDCMRLALDDAVLAPADVGHVNAHGTSTQLNDRAEAEAIAKLFGPRALPVTATKGVVGHLIGAAGALEALVAIESVRRDVVPPTANASEVDGEIDALVDVAQAAVTPRTSVAITNSFGFGGHNATLVVGR